MAEQKDTGVGLKKNSGLTPRQQRSVDALTRLCEREGLSKVVKSIGSSYNTLWLIIHGKTHKNGRVRGIGPSLQARLDAAYPGWDSQEGIAAAESKVRDSGYRRFCQDVYAKLENEEERECANRMVCLLEDIAISLRKIAAMQCGAGGCKE